MKIMSVFGTRPEAIKMCPLIKEMQMHSEIKSVVCLTGQHKEMLQQVIDIFSIQVDYNLHIMKPLQTLTTITTDILILMKPILEKERPDIVFMDICMPEMNGLQMIAALNSQFPDLEVSVLTGYRDFEYAKEAIRLGVTRFLLKPSNMDELEEAIECMCANLNLAHFSRVFKKQVGVSANEYRNQVLGK